MRKYLWSCARRSSTSARLQKAFTTRARGTCCWPRRMHVPSANDQECFHGTCHAGDAADPDFATCRCDEGWTPSYCNFARARAPLARSPTPSTARVSASVATGNTGRKDAMR